MRKPRTTAPDGAAPPGPADPRRPDAVDGSRRLFTFAALALPMSMAATSSRSNQAADLSSQTPVATDTAMTPDQIDTTLQAMAESFRTLPRGPILHRPDEAGLAYEDVFFPSEDGVPLEGWFIPRPGSSKIIIANHPRWFTRSGLPSHL